MSTIIEYEEQPEARMETNNAKFPDDPSVTLTIRLIMQGKVSHLHTIIDFSGKFSQSNRLRYSFRQNAFPSLNSRIRAQLIRDLSFNRFTYIKTVNLSSLWSFTRNLLLYFFLPPSAFFFALLARLPAAYMSTSQSTISDSIRNRLRMLWGKKTC